MLHFVLLTLAAAFSLATAIKMEYCPVIYWNRGSTENCSSFVYNRTDVIANESVQFCVQTKFRCNTINTVEPAVAILHCRNWQENLRFEHTIAGYRNVVSAVNFSICRTWSSPKGCSFQADEPEPVEAGWNLLVESRSVPSLAFNVDECNCKPYWEYAQAQWLFCNARYSLKPLIGVRVLVIVGLVALAVSGCVVFSVKFKQGLVRVDTVQLRAWRM